MPKYTSILAHVPGSVHGGDYDVTESLDIGVNSFVFYKVQPRCPFPTTFELKQVIVYMSLRWYGTINFAN